MSSLGQIISLEELSALLGLSKNALRWHIRQGRITPFRLGRRLLFDRDRVLNELLNPNDSKTLGHSNVRGVSSQKFFEMKIAERALSISEKESK